MRSFTPPLVAAYALLVGSCPVYALPASDSSDATSLTVSTTSGTFAGFNNGKGLEAWLGLPFAQPPVGSLRFKAPVPITKPLVSGVQNASAFGHVCPQPDGNFGATQGEDCLHLNVRHLAAHSGCCGEYKRSYVRSSLISRQIPGFPPSRYKKHGEAPGTILDTCKFWNATSWVCCGSVRTNVFLFYLGWSFYDEVRCFSFRKTCWASLMVY